MTAAREAILGRVREALAGAPAPPAVPRDYRRRGELGPNALLELLVERLEETGARVVRTNDPAATIADELRRLGVDDVVVDPALPQEAIDAMRRIGAGPVAKVFVTYDERWWPGVRAIRIAGDTDLVVAVDATEVTGVPTLCWFAVGDGAARVEAMSEDELCRLADDVARRARLPQGD